MKKQKRAGKTKEQLLMEMSAKKFGAMKISACWIARNEEKNLPRSIESVKGVVDELIVVDTGSTDGTIDAARSLGATVIESEWADDFSTPRNLALEHATGDWIIFLDADEYFPEGAEQNIRQSIQLAVQRRKVALLIKLVNVDVDTGNEEINSTYLCRIFKRGLHYVGRIHEELRTEENKSVEKILPVPDSVMLIIHTGYSSGVNREKAARNLQMLLKELDSSDEPQRIYGYIAQCYNGLDDFDNAEKYARLDIEHSRKDSTFASSSHRILIRILSGADVDRLEERLSEARRSVEDFPSMPEFRAELAECLAAGGDYARAVREMRQALRSFENYKGMEPTTFDRSMANFAEDRIEQWIKIIGGQNL